jgi:exopolysaccharide biosynthesis polyprenyl glycosylphosphotransferase
MGIDAVAAFLAMALAYKLRFYPGLAWCDWSFLGRLAEARPYLLMLILIPFVRVVSGYVAGVYRVPRKVYRAVGELPALVGAATLGSAIVALIAFFGVLQFQSLAEYQSFSYSRVVVVYDWLLFLFFSIAAHTFVGIVRNELSRRGLLARRVAIQGRGRDATALIAEQELLGESGYQLVGVIADEAGEAPASAEGRRPAYLGHPRDLLDLVNTHQIHEIVVTNAASLGWDMVDFCEECHKLDVVVKYVPDLGGLLFRGQPVEGMAGVPIVQVNEIGIVGLPRLVKRIEDIAIAAGVLLLASPIMLATALAIKLESRGPVFFIQQRLGKHGRAIRVFKFRSMRADAEALRARLEAQNQSDGVVFKIKDDPRITRVGRFIRRTSIDELPQLFNVLAGSMSLVGPRPLPMSDISHPDKWDKRRFAAVPGITGLWQVNRVDHSSEEMLRWDLYYVENWSLWLDLSIILKTVYVVLARRGAY